MGRRPFRSITQVTDEFQMSDDLRKELLKVSLDFVKAHRQKSPEQAEKDFQGLPEALSLRFLERNGDYFFVEGKAALTMDSDYNKVVGGIAEILARQNDYQADSKLKVAPSKRMVDAMQDDFSLGKRQRVQPKFGGLITNQDLDGQEDFEYSGTSTDDRDWSERSPRSKMASMNRNKASRKAAGNRALWSLSIDSSDEEPITSPRLTRLGHGLQRDKRSQEQDDDTIEFVVPDPAETRQEPSPTKPRMQVPLRKDPRGQETVPARENHDEDNDDMMSDRTEEPAKQQTFCIHSGLDEFELTAEQCAVILQSTVTHLDRLRVDLRMAQEERKTVDSLARVTGMLRAFGKKARSTSST